MKTSELRCYVPTCACISPLFRQNAKGVAPIWACQLHSKPINDHLLVDLINAIDKGSHSERTS